MSRYIDNQRIRIYVSINRKKEKNMNKKNKARRIVQYFIQSFLLVMIFAACQSIKQTKTILFDSGEGTGSYDNMTYAQYESRVIFTPQENLLARSINPKINYCNGSCGYNVCVFGDQIAEPLACQTGLIDTINQ